MDLGAPVGNEAALAGRQRIVGLVALVATVLLWSTFALTIRAIGTSSLTTLDVALLRFTVPVVLLAPWSLRAFRAVRRQRTAVRLAVLSAGLPHFLVMALGGHLTSSALVGLLVPGTVPLFVSLLAFIVWRRRITAIQAVALVAISVGVALSASQSVSREMTGGIIVLLGAGFVWGIYTLGLRASTLMPIDVVLYVGSLSAVAAVVLALSGAMPSHLLAGTARLHDVLMFGLLQGVGTGVLSTVAYATAVRQLGSGVAAASGAVTPVLTAVLAVPILGEALPSSLLLPLTLIAAGVAVFNLLGDRSLRGARGIALSARTRRRAATGHA